MFKRYIWAKFIPQRDISTYELAEIVSHVMLGRMGTFGWVRFTPYQWETLRPEIRRHFYRTTE